MLCVLSVTCTYHYSVHTCVINGFVCIWVGSNIIAPSQPHFFHKTVDCVLFISSLHGIRPFFSCVSNTYVHNRIYIKWDRILPKRLLLNSCFRLVVRQHPAWEHKFILYKFVYPKRHEVAAHDFIKIYNLSSL